MLCEVGRRLNDALAAATRAVGQHAEANRSYIKDAAYAANEEALERTRREASFAFTEHRENCPTCASR